LPRLGRVHFHLKPLAAERALNFGEFFHGVNLRTFGQSATKEFIFGRADTNRQQTLAEPGASWTAVARREPRHRFWGTTKYTKHTKILSGRLSSFVCLVCFVVENVWQKRRGAALPAALHDANRPAIVSSHAAKLLEATDTETSHVSTLFK
jgi:hypothetical protein